MFRERFGTWGAELADDEFAWALLALGLLWHAEGGSDPPVAAAAEKLPALLAKQGALGWSIDSTPAEGADWAGVAPARELADALRGASLPARRFVVYRAPSSLPYLEVSEYFGSSPEAAGLRDAGWQIDFLMDRDLDDALPAASAPPEPPPEPAASVGRKGTLLNRIRARVARRPVKTVITPPPEKMTMAEAPDEVPMAAPPDETECFELADEVETAEVPDEVAIAEAPEEMAMAEPPGESAMAAPPAEDTAPAARFLQTAVVAPSDAETPIVGPLMQDTDYRARVFIGRPKAGYKHATESIPLPPPEPEGAPHELFVVFWEPTVCPKPAIKRMLLGPADTDEAGCEFEFRSPASDTVLHARVTVLHRSRVLQTGVFDVPVGAESGSPAFVLDAVPKAFLGNLDVRTEFDASFVFDQLAREGVVHAVAGDSPMVFNMSDASIRSMLDTYDIAVTAVTNQPDKYKGLDTQNSVELLRSLAQVGASAREYLASQQGQTHLDRPRKVQVVSPRPGALFPVELLYDLDAPEDDAKLCERYREALGPAGPRDASEWCADCSPHAKTVEERRATLCPLAFWGLRGVVERKTFEPQDRSIGGEFALAPEPGQDTDVLLHPLECAVVGTAVEVLEDDATKMRDAIKSQVGVFKVASDWDELMKDIGESPTPTLLVLVAHQTRDEVSGAPILHIGKSRLKSDHLSDEHVRPSKHVPPPVVLVLGCETALSDVDFQSFVGRFKIKGAAVVVGTLSKVLGRHAGPAASALVDCIAAAETPTSFGTIMRDVRRRVLLEVSPMALALVALGDADWDVDSQRQVQ